MSGLILLYLVGYFFLVLPVTMGVGLLSKSRSVIRRYGVPYVLTCGSLRILGMALGDSFFEDHYSNYIFQRHAFLFLVLWIGSFTLILFLLRAFHRESLMHHVLSVSSSWKLIRSKIRNGKSVGSIRSWITLFLLIEFTPLSFLLFSHFHVPYTIIDIAYADFENQRHPLRAATVIGKKARTAGRNGSPAQIFLDRTLFDGHSHVYGQHFFETCYIGSTFQYRVYRSYFGNPVLRDKKCISP